MAEFTMDPKFLANVSRAAQAATLAAGATYLGLMADTLTNEPPRRGRLYEKRVGKNGRLYLYPITGAGTSELGTHISARAYRGRRRKTTTSTGTRRKRTVRLHRASAPGEPPALLTAALRKNRASKGRREARHSGGGFDSVVVFGSRVPYARRLEVGGKDKRGQMIEARPAWVPTMVDNWDAILASYRRGWALG